MNRNLFAALARFEHGEQSTVEGLSNKIIREFVAKTFQPKITQKLLFLKAWKKPVLNVGKRS